MQIVYHLVDSKVHRSVCVRRSAQVKNKAKKGALYDQGKSGPRLVESKYRSRCHSKAQTCLRLLNECMQDTVFVVPILTLIFHIYMTIVKFIFKSI